MQRVSKLVLLTTCCMLCSCQQQRADAITARPQVAYASAPAAPNETTLPTHRSIERPRPPGSIGSRVFVAEGASRSLAVYDLNSRSLLPERIRRLGDMAGASMLFSPDLESGYVATRTGKLSRIDLATLTVKGSVFAAHGAIQIAVSQDGHYVAVTDDASASLTLFDAKTLEVVKRLPAGSSQLTGLVAAPGNRFVCVLMEGAAVWVVDASGTPEQVAVRNRIETSAEPHDAMLTSDGRYYVVGHRDSDQVSIIDLARPDRGVREVALRDSKTAAAKTARSRLPYMASWATAGGRVFVPLSGEKRLAVFEADTFRFLASVQLGGNPVHAVRSPNEHEIWVSFSGAEDDAYVQVVDTDSLSTKHKLNIGMSIDHIDFTARGTHALVSANHDNLLALVDTTSYAIVDREAVRSPSGAFGAWEALRAGL